MFGWIAFGNAAMSDRPVLRCLIYQFTGPRLTYQVIPLEKWEAERDVMRGLGWRFIGVDPCDEMALVLWEQGERSKHWKSR